jgi:hypothetical protein
MKGINSNLIILAQILTVDSPTARKTDKQHYFPSNCIRLFLMISLAA